MKKFGLLRSMIALVALTLCIGLAFWLLSSREQDWTVRITTATPGGTYYPLGIQLAHILKDEVPEIRDASIWETSGSVQNICLLGNPRREYKNAAERERAKKGIPPIWPSFKVRSLRWQARTSARSSGRLRGLQGLHSGGGQSPCATWDWLGPGRR